MNNNVEYDTNKMKDASTEIKKIVNEINTQINKMYKLFDEMTESAWVGKNSRDYSNTVFLDKSDYVEYMNSIGNIAKEIESLSDKIESMIRICEREADNI